MACWWFGGVWGVCLVWGAALGSCGACFWVCLVVGLLFCSFGVRSCVRLCLLRGCWAKVFVGVCGCLGVGCVVRGGGLSESVGVAVLLRVVWVFRLMWVRVCLC